MNYTKGFEDAVKFCNKNKLFLGYGNPNGKILIIGKEHYFAHKDEKDSDKFYNEIIEKRELENKNNIASWKDNIENNFQPNWNSDLEYFLDNSNAYLAWWNQRNIQNRQLKNGNWNNGTSNTYLHYQKLYQNTFLDGEKKDRINFQKEFFITELNDLPSKKSFNRPRLNELRKEFITQRKDLFNLPFFKSFPATIIATGHYPKEYDFNIEKLFNVKWTGKTEKIGDAWYNLHHGIENKNRVVIHTRQLSTSVTNDLINALSEKLKSVVKT